eukprot:GILI01029453.1.p1 GENE.GILI01029453.1~~GILI01029453.1.p1  ORF type:complete len:575 (+),score=138.86 GILI01029453.1:49-1725(+)
MHLTENDWDLLLSLAEKRDYKEGDVLVDWGASHDNLFIIRRGQVMEEQPEQHLPDGTVVPAEAVMYLGPLDVFGEQAVLLGYEKASHRVVAATPAVELHAIPSHKTRALPSDSLRRLHQFARANLDLRREKYSLTLANSPRRSKNPSSFTFPANNNASASPGSVPSTPSTSQAAPSVSLTPPPVPNQPLLSPVRIPKYPAFDFPVSPQADKKSTQEQSHQLKSNNNSSGVAWVPSDPDDDLSFIDRPEEGLADSSDRGLEEIPIEVESRTEESGHDVKEGAGRKGEGKEEEEHAEEDFPLELSTNSLMSGLSVIDEGELSLSEASLSSESQQLAMHFPMVSRKRDPELVSKQREVYLSSCQQLQIRPNSAILALLDADTPVGDPEVYDLSLNFIGVRQVAPLAAALRLDEGMRGLLLHKQNLDCAAIADLARELQGHSRLSSLDISHNRFGLAGARKVLELVRSCPRLAFVNMKGTVLDEDLSTRRALIGEIDSVRRQIRNVVERNAIRLIHHGVQVSYGFDEAGLPPTVSVREEGVSVREEGVDESFDAAVWAAVPS